MGFDLYGRNPHNPSGHVRPNIDWTDSSITEDDKKEYFDAVDKYESRVKGDYFRANVWWWRPIWNFVTNYCDDILSDKDIEKGSFNDGHFINKAKSKKIASRIKTLIKDGTAKKIEDEYNTLSEKARKHNSKVDAMLDDLKEEVIKETKKDNIVPSDYPKKFKDRWDEIYKMRSWADSYPFDVEYLESFADFSEQSGGFEIC